MNNIEKGIEKTKPHKLAIIVIITAILSYIFYFFNNYLLFFCTYLMSSLVFSIYLDNLEWGKVIILILGTFNFYTSISLITEFHKNTLYEKWIFGTWLTLTIITLPYFLYKFFNKYIYKNDRILYKFKPKNREEIKREDSIIIGIVGFLQAIFSLNILDQNLIEYQKTIIFGTVLFAIIRGYAIIKDKWIFRSYSTYILISIIITDIIIYLNLYILEWEQIVIIKNIINIPIDIVIFSLLIYFIFFSTALLSKMIDNRYFY